MGIYMCLHLKVMSKYYGSLKLLVNGIIHVVIVFATRGSHMYSSYTHGIINYNFHFQGNLSVMQDLLQQGLNPNVRDNAGWTPLVS